MSVCLNRCDHGCGQDLILAPCSTILHYTQIYHCAIALPHKRITMATLISHGGKATTPLLKLKLKQNGRAQRLKFKYPTQHAIRTSSAKTNLVKKHHLQKRHSESFLSSKQFIKHKGVLLEGRFPELRSFTKLFDSCFLQFLARHCSEQVLCPPQPNGPMLPCLSH